MKSGYQVIQQDRFIEDLKALHPKMARADEIVFAVDWRLARDPKRGKHIVGNLWCDVGRPGERTRAVILYTFNEQK